MQRLLALLGLLALLAAPAAEQIHEHGMGMVHTDCPACQVKSNPADQVTVQTAPVGSLQFQQALWQTPHAPLLETDRLRVAPKTSPPSDVV